MFNLILGIVFIAGGLSGEMALIGTNSPTALAVVGVGLSLLGVYQMANRRADGE